MAIKKGQDSPQAPTEPSATPRTESDQEIRRAEASLVQIEGLVDEALAEPDELGDAAWRLTLAQWRLGRHDRFARQWPRQAAIVIATVATIAYLNYRLFWTLNLASAGAIAFSVVLFAAECYAGFSLLLYFYQVWRLVEPPLRRPTPGRSVDVFVTTYNEDVTLLRGTLMACVAMDYPHTTYVLDDGARDEVRLLAESLGVRYISRTDRTHAKAGNLNNALRQTDGEFVVILDADHVPSHYYLSRLIGHFDDPKMGFVQTPHTTYNLDNFLGRWNVESKAYWEDVRIFFEAVQLGKNRHGVACFCGSAAMFRRKALENVGLLATETITEDMHTGMRINAAGWKSIAVSEEMVVGLAPNDAETFASQRLRWGEGNLSVMAYDNPLTMKGLTLPGRINHFASIASWTLGPARLVLYLTPLVMLLTGIAPVADMSVAYFVVVACYLGTVWTAVKLASNRCGQLLGIESAMMASFHLQLRSLWRALFRRHRQKFVVTAKGNGQKHATSYRMWPQAALVVLSIVAVSWAASRAVFGISVDYLGLAIGSGLAGYHSWLALTVLARAARKRNGSRQWRHPARLAASYTLDGATRSAVSLEFNENECCLLTWDRLTPATTLRVMLRSPAGEADCEGRVIDSAPLGHDRPFAYASTIRFSSADPEQAERQSDALRNIAMQYVVPVVTMAHRFVRRGRWPSHEVTSAESDLPIPLTIDATLPNLAPQETVATSMNESGFYATLENPCPVDHVVGVTLSTPLGAVSTQAEVQDVEAIRISSTIVHEHKFGWRNPDDVRQVMANRRRWTSAIHGATSRPHGQRLPLIRVLSLQLAACIIAALTVFTFGAANQEDILLAMAARQPIAEDQRERLEIAIRRKADSKRASVDSLVRAYDAAISVGNHRDAAKAARALGNRVKKGRCTWMLTSARQLMQAGDPRAADAAFDEIFSRQLQRELSPDRRAELYVEAARAAVGANDLDKGVDYFLKASDLKMPKPEVAEEILGVLIAAGRSQLALQVLGQMDRSDRVLRHIVDVHEMAKQPAKAIPELEELMRRHPEDALVVRRLAEIAVVQRDYVAGVNYYKALCAARPDDETAKQKLAETMLMLARRQAEDGLLDRAIATFDESFALEKPGNELKQEYAGILAKAGHYTKAVEVLDGLPTPAARLLLASLLEMQGDDQRALDTLLALEKSGVPLGSESERSIVRLLMAGREYNEAADRLVGLMRSDPGDPALRRMFIDAMAAARGESEEARQALVELAAEYRQSGYQGLDAEGFERLGDALGRLGLLRQASSELQEAVARYPDARRLRLRLAQTLGKLGEYEAAEKQFDILLRTRPTLRR